MKNRFMNIFTADAGVMSDAILDLRESSDSLDSVSSFGYQWSKFSRDQLDSYSGLSLSEDRFVASANCPVNFFKGKLVLDVGCGTGRFAEIALKFGASVVCLDPSEAIYSCRENLKGYGDRVLFVRDFLRKDLFKPGVFDVVYCLGVIQHMESPLSSIQTMVDAVKPQGGAVFCDVYERKWHTSMNPRFLVRKLMKPKSDVEVMDYLEENIDWLMGLKDFLSKIPVAGNLMARGIPIASYPYLSGCVKRRWALLDTFDMWKPSFDSPQSEFEMREAFRLAGLSAIEVSRPGHLVVRGVKL